ncbi:MAG TPA: copper amine oxidase N-terminal domain-containing protein, partial [Bacilli bacterium]
DYDFTGGTGNKASYAQFNKEEGILLVGEPTKVEMKVLGDESRNWIRAELLDAGGVLHRVDVNTNVNWKGWRTVSADLASLQMAYPVKLVHVYVASPDLGHDERVLKGQIAIDDITFQYSGKLADAINSRIVLAINRKSLTVGERQVILDQAPIIMNATTMIPVKFVVEALGGTVAWEEKERKVTLIRENRLIEMWIDKLDLLSNGRRVTPLVAPTIRGGRTMVPLKVIAQEMGWKVTWIGETKTIILE